MPTSANPSSRARGVTLPALQALPVLDAVEPTEAELAVSEQLKQDLELDFPRETAEGLAHREQVLEELEGIVSEWILEEGRSQGAASLGLGVVQPGSDMDTLCIAPPHVAREAFFTAFLKKLENHPHVSDCVPIPGACLGWG
ncbi:unnamed protein product [Cladocopium goreaui]|uniref:Poly(A) polymerase (PAP) (Polynucleotid e adenylyltransferase) n=1 Tax=Cladocopium goreaui TaxID=2562237 RepID=A0A9P1CBV0_9DINO|nr:unnamed protein product [Cladocopium goreaui]